MRQNFFFNCDNSNLLTLIEKNLIYFDKSKFNLDAAIYHVDIESIVNIDKVDAYFHHTLPWIFVL